MEQFNAVFWLGVATASITFITTKTPVFDAVRARMQRDSFLFELWSCPICMGPYVAAFFWILFQPKPFGMGALDAIPCIFIMVTVQTIIVQLIMICGRLNRLMARALGEK